MNLGAIYLDLDKLDQALTFTLKALDVNPNNLKALINLSMIYDKQNDQINQRLTLNKAKAIDPTSLNLFLMAIQIFKKVHMHELDIDDERSKFIEATRYFLQQNPDLRLQYDIPLNFGVFGCLIMVERMTKNLFRNSAAH